MNGAQYMKSTKEASKMTITLLLMVFVIWMAIEKSTIGVVAGVVLLFVWVMLVYKLFTDVTLKFQNFLLSLKQKPTTTEKVKNQSSVSKQEQDKFSKSFQKLNESIKNNTGLSAVGPSYSSPKFFDRFIEIKHKADEEKYDFKNDHNYYEVNTYLIRNILTVLGTSIKLRMFFHSTYNLLGIDLEQLNSQVFNGKEVDFETLATIENQIEKADSDPNIPISFSKAKSDLKKLQA